MTVPKDVWLREIAALILDIKRAGAGKTIGKKNTDKKYFEPVMWALIWYQVHLAGQILYALNRGGLDYLAVLGAGALYEAAISQSWIAQASEAEKETRAKAYWEYQYMGVLVEYEAGLLSKEDAIKEAEKHLKIFVKKNRVLTGDKFLDRKNYYTKWYGEKSLGQMENEVAAGDTGALAVYKLNYAVYCQYKHGDPGRVISANPLFGEIKNKEYDWKLSAIMTLAFLTSSAQIAEKYIFHTGTNFEERLRKFVPNETTLEKQPFISYTLIT